MSLGVPYSQSPLMFKYSAPKACILSSGMLYQLQVCRYWPQQDLQTPTGSALVADYARKSLIRCGVGGMLSNCYDYDEVHMGLTGLDHRFRSITLPVPMTA